MIHFCCSHCNAPYDVPDEWAGDICDCQKCGTRTPIPGRTKTGTPIDYGVQQAPSYPTYQRTPKWKIIARLGFLPLGLMAFLSMLMYHADEHLAGVLMLSSLGTYAFAVFFMWAFTNITTAIACPQEYKLWKAGGGDPYFDTVDFPFNTDPAEVRYQELYREKARQELEDMFGVQPDLE